MLELTITEMRNITQAIREKYGYDFSNYASSSFKRRIVRILEINKINPDLLVEKIRNDKFTREEFLHEVTVNVTEMFRDPSFWKTLKPQMESMFKIREKIRIWHAGCSSGEEVFSMLIMLKEMGVLDKTEIVASDIDKSILARAKEGKISVKSMEVNIHNYQRYSGSTELDKYFTKHGDFLYFDKSMLQRVNFRDVNLVTATPFNKFDLILCRNVLIYFNNILQNQVITLFSDCMFDGGLLAIGAKESMAWCEVAKRFTCLNLDEKIYSKNKSK